MLAIVLATVFATVAVTQAILPGYLLSSGDRFPVSRLETLHIHVDHLLQRVSDGDGGVVLCSVALCCVVFCALHCVVLCYVVLRDGVLCCAASCRVVMCRFLSVLRCCIVLVLYWYKRHAVRLPH